MAGDKTSLAVFVHGLNASADDWWGITRNSLETFARHDHIRFLFWQYATDIKPRPSVAAASWLLGEKQKLGNLDQIGRQLWGSLEVEITDNPVNSIAFFGHSMGGLVVASALVNGYKNKGNPASDKLLSAISVISLCGTPLAGSNLAELANFIMKFYGGNTHIENLCKDSKTRQRIVAEFQNRVKLTGLSDEVRKLLEFFEVVQDEIVQEDNERYGPFLSQEKRRVSLEGSHVGCVQNLTSDHDNFKKISFWLCQHLPQSVPMISGSVEIPEDNKDQEIMPTFDRIVDDIRKHLRSKGVFNDWRPLSEDKWEEGEHVNNDYLLRIFLQTLVFASTKMHECALGSANAWVCHNASEATGMPTNLRSEEREGYFQIDQLVTTVAPPGAVAFRPFPVSFESAVYEELSAAARAVAKEIPVVVDLQETFYDSKKERNLGITHIIGFPLFFRSEERITTLEGVPMAITVDFKFDMDFPEIKVVIEEIFEKCRVLMTLFKEFRKVWHGRLSLKCNGICTQDVKPKGRQNA